MQKTEEQISNFAPHGPLAVEEVPRASGTPYGITDCTISGLATEKPLFQVIPVKPGMTLLTSRATLASAMKIRFDMGPTPVQFHCCLKGRCRHRFDGISSDNRELWTQPGTFTASCPSGTRGECEMRGGEEHLMVGIHVDPELILKVLTPGGKPCKAQPGLLSTWNLTSPFIFQTGISPAMEALAHQIIDGPPLHLPRALFYESKALELLALQLARVEQADAHACSHPPRKRGDRERILDARNYLVQHLKAPPSPEELAHITGINLFKLKSGFKELFGMTLFDYLRSQRMETAKQCIEREEMNVNETAWEVGYTNVSHFIRAYKKQHGVKPGEMIKSCQLS